MPIQAGYHSRGFLPHLKVEGAIYFVTFRLADSLPWEVVARLKEQRQDLLQRAKNESPQPPADAGPSPFAWYAQEIDIQLDRSNGAAWLRRPELATLVTDTLLHFESKRYSLHAWCVMPNHVHVVVRPLEPHALDAILHSWKSFTAREANRRLNLAGQPFWQRESYDQWIRDAADFAHCCRYTEENPVKAALCAKPEDWPWSSASKK